MALVSCSYKYLQKKVLVKFSEVRNFGEKMSGNLKVIIRNSQIFTDTKRDL